MLIILELHTLWVKYVNIEMCATLVMFFAVVLKCLYLCWLLISLHCCLHISDHLQVNNPFFSLPYSCSSFCPASPT